MSSPLPIVLGTLGTPRLVARGWVVSIFESMRWRSEAGGNATLKPQIVRELLGLLVEHQEGDLAPRPAAP